jgi:hypothetical protein
MTNNKKTITEGHDDLVHMLVRCRIKIEEREDPTVLDIMTDMRALPGIVTIRQTRPVSDIVSSNGHRIIELNVSYIEKYILEKNKFISLIKSFKKIDGLYMVKVLEHDSKSITRKIKKSPIII